MILAVLALGASGTHAQSPDPFLAVRNADPVELARVVDRLGDGAVLERLDAGRSRAVRLAAVRASDQMHEPELALDALSTMASGRDPLLAPAAAQAALQVARMLTPDGLARREAEPAALAPARQRLAALADDESARPDQRVIAAMARARLDTLGVPASGE